MRPPKSRRRTILIACVIIVWLPLLLDVCVGELGGSVPYLTAKSTAP